MLGFQLWQQAHSNWQPNLRFTIQEIFPTGRFEELSATNAGSDGTGAGSYQSVFSLNFQHLLFMGFEHYLRTRLDLSYLLAQPVNIHGISTYGGIEATNGVIKPGHLRSIDFSGEFTLNQNWVAVMECYYFYRSGSNFRGNPGTRPNGTIAQIGYEDVQEYSLAPGIEYNFSSHYGILAGLWFAIKGKDAVKFESIVIAFNAYW